MDDQSNAQVAIQKQQQTFETNVLNKISFKQNIDPELYNQLKEKFKASSQQSKYCFLSDSKQISDILVYTAQIFQASILKRLLPYVKEWKQTNISFQNRKLPTLLKQLSSIFYPNLTYIYLGNNKIQSIQCIAHLDAPNLIKLYLYHNQITTFKPLHKTKLPKLFRVSIYDNKCVQLQKFQDILWDENQIQWISLEDTNIKQVTYDHLKLLKLKPQLKQLWINSVNRIQHKALKMFKNKNGPQSMMHYPQEKKA